MYSPSDDDCRALLAEMRIDPEHAGAKNAKDRLRLLQTALQKTQGVGRVLKKAADSSSSSSSSSRPKLNPASLKKLKPRSSLLATDFSVEKMFTLQETMTTSMGSKEMATAWFELRMTLCDVIDKHVEHGTTRLHLVDRHQPHKMGGVLDFMGARLAPDGKLSLLETRHRFFYTHQLQPGSEYPAVEMRTNPPGPYGSVVVEVEQEELKLMAVLFDTNAGLLDPEYVSAQQAAWGTGSHLTPSFLLPIEPLTQEVKLPKTCQVCGEEGARDCSACHQIAYCSKDCQAKDWKQHKPSCKAAQASSSTSSTSGSSSTSSSSSFVLVDLQAKLGEEFVSVVPTNVSSRRMHKMANKSPTPGQGGVAEGVKADPNKKFIVKIQAPMTDDAGGMPLFLYDEKRKIVAYIQSNQQPTFNTLLAKIRQHGYMGAKAYFTASLDSLERLRVHTDTLPSQVHSW